MSLTRHEIETLDDEALARRIREHKEREYAELCRHVGASTRRLDMSKAFDDAMKDPRTRASMEELWEAAETFALSENENFLCRMAMLESEELAGLITEKSGKAALADMAFGLMYQAVLCGAIQSVDVRTGRVKFGGELGDLEFTDFRAGGEAGPPDLTLCMKAVDRSCCMVFRGPDEPR